jgi:predicted nuclease of restriction endonuclease-like (RecB) superfamily
MANKRRTIWKSSAQAERVDTLFAGIRELILTARRAVVRSVDALQVMTSFEIGRRIVEHEQQGSARAEYGKHVLRELAERLTAEFGRGFSRSNLEYMRKFFLTYRQRLPQKSQMPSGKSQPRPHQKSQMPSGGLSAIEPFVQRSVAQTALPFRLSWSQYVFLMGINDDRERSFYEIESENSGWALPELKRQFNASLYERLALSRGKEGIRKLAREGQAVAQPQDFLKEPYVLEFLGLDEKKRYSESDLESAIIDKLEHFLLELGKGFLFEARQKRFTFDEDHFFVDLVFYNRLLRSYVLIDLKIGKLTHQDLGQMQMYVNYFDRSVKMEDESPTIGIILCKKKHDALVEITLPKDAHVHAKEYRLYLPSKGELKRKLLEWAEEQEEQPGQGSPPRSRKRPPKSAS